MKASPEEMEARMNMTYRRKEHEGIKRQKLDTESLSAERLYYHWEDKFLIPEAELSFSYLSTFTEIDEDGKKH